MHFGATEIVIIIFIVLLLFGGKRLPGLAKSLGASILSFRKGIENPDKSDNETEEK